MKVLHPGDLEPHSSKSQGPASLGLSIPFDALRHRVGCSFRSLWDVVCYVPIAPGVNREMDRVLALDSPHSFRRHLRSHPTYTPFADDLKLVSPRPSCRPPPLSQPQL